MEPLISVIVPVYNPGKYLIACLDSLVNQTYRNLEIILIDDGSTDDSAATCAEYALKDARIVFRKQRNGGVSSARNHGLSLAKGEYLSFIDSDDYLDEDTYEHLIQLIQAHQCDVVMFEYYITTKAVDKARKLAGGHYGLLDRNRAMFEFMDNAPFLWSKLFPHKMAEGLEFDETIARGEDSLFARSVLDRADKVYYTNRPLYHYVQSEESAVRGKFRPSQLSALKLIDINRPFYKEKYPELLKKWTAGMEHLLIMLYFDMYADEQDYRAQQSEVRKRFRELYPDAMSFEQSKKKRVKFWLFRYFPRLFCIVHKLSM